MGLRPGCHPGQDGLTVGIAPGLVVQAGVRRIVLAAYQSGQALPGVRHLRSNHQITVVGGERAIHRALRQVMAGLHRQLLAAAHQIALGGKVVHGDHAVVQGDVDVLSAATAHAAKQRGANCRHAVHAGVHVGDGHAKQRRRFARHANQRHGAALGFGDQAEPRPRRVRPGVPISRDRAINEFGVAPGKLFIAQAQFVQGAGAVVLDEHVGAVGELVHHLQAARVTQVDAQALLAHVLLQEVATLALHEGRAGTSGITCHRPLDLDDLGAHRTQAARHVRAGQKVAVVDDAYACQRQGLRGLAT